MTCRRPPVAMLAAALALFSWSPPPLQAQGPPPQDGAGAIKGSGDLAAVLTLLVERCRQQPALRVASFSCVLQGGETGPWRYDAVLQPAQGDDAKGRRISTLTTFLAEVVLRIPSEVRVESLTVTPERTTIKGQAHTFEAVNAFRNNLDAPKAYWFRGRPFPEAHKAGPFVAFTFDLEMVDPASLALEPDLGTVGRAKAHASELSMGAPAPPKGTALGDVTFKGILVSRGSTFAVVTDEQGGVRMLPVGYRFRDAEIVKIEAPYVTVRQFDGDAYRTLVIRVPPGARTAPAPTPGKP